MKGYHDSKTPAGNRDTWMTPRWLFDYLDNIYKFAADVCASDQNHLKDIYWTEENSCLDEGWGWKLPSHCMVWCNPPYSAPRLFIDKAAKENKTNHIGTVMLLPADTSVSWFHEATKTASEIIFLTEGRVNFISSVDGVAKSGNNKGSMLIIWGSNLSGQCKFSTLSIKTIKGKK